MQDVFALWHIHELEDDYGTHEEVKFIGVFSSEARAQETVAFLKEKDGFQEYPADCFQIHKVKVDQPSWTDGFCTVRWIEP